MKQWQGKMKFAGVGGTILLAGSEVSAQTISWGPASTTVPMSTSASLLMAGLFMLAGVWLLSKSRKHLQQFAAAALLMAGVYNITAEAVAVHSVSITTDTGTELLFDGVNEIQNNSGEAVKITNIDEDGCSITSQSCTLGLVLAPGEGCHIDLACD